MEAQLIWNELEKNENGFPVKKPHTVDVYVDEKEIVRSEFYDAMRSGIAVKKILELRVEDYELSRHVDDNGKTAYATEIKYEDMSYKIIRTYKRCKAKIELTCGGM